MGTELHTLKPPAGARKKKKRVGRGPGSGVGKTSGRGMKGQKARNTVRAQFEGGQNPIHRRVPKRGFVNIHRVEIHSVNVARLEAAFDAGAEIDLEAMHAKGVVPKKAKYVKVLGGGDLSKKLTIKAHGVSETAKSKIEAAGGSVELLPIADKIKPVTRKPKG